MQPVRELAMLSPRLVPEAIRRRMRDASVGRISVEAFLRLGLEGKFGCTSCGVSVRVDRILNQFQVGSNDLIRVLLKRPAENVLTKAESIGGHCGVQNKRTAKIYGQ